MENSEIFSQAIQFRGHPNVLGTHRNTLEITMDQNISRRADCIIGVDASCGCAGLNAEIKNHIKAGGHLQIEIFVKGMSYVFIGRGSPDLELLDPHEMVFRKSDFVSSRTAAVSCSAAATNVPRDIIRLLQSSQNFGVMKIIALNKTLSLEPEVPQIEFL